MSTSLRRRITRYLASTRSARETCRLCTTGTLTYEPDPLATHCMLLGGHQYHMSRAFRIQLWRREDPVNREWNASQTQRDVWFLCRWLEEHRRANPFPRVLAISNALARTVERRLAAADGSSHGALPPG